MTNDEYWVAVAVPRIRRWLETACDKADARLLLQYEEACKAANVVPEDKNGAQNE